MILALPQSVVHWQPPRGSDAATLFATLFGGSADMSRYDVLISQATQDKDSLAEPLAPSLISRISLVRHAFSDVMPDTLTQVMERFRRDAHLERELSVWESMAAVYLDFKAVFKPDAQRCRAAFLVLLELSMGRLRPRTKKQWAALSTEEFRFLRARWDVFGSGAQAGTKPLH